jgi:hypothetical protein
MFLHPSFVPGCRRLDAWVANRDECSHPKAALPSARGHYAALAQNGKRRRNQRKDDIAISLVIHLA